MANIANLPIGYRKNFDPELSLKKCPSKKNLPKQYQDDFEFVGREIVDVKTITRTAEIQVRKKRVATGNVVDIAESYSKYGWLHYKYPPIVIEDENGNRELWVGNNRFDACDKVRPKKWTHLMVDVYRCKNRRALLTTGCTTNHHKDPFEKMSKADYIKVGIMAAYGDKKNPPVLELNGNGNPSVDTIQEYVEEICGNDMNNNEKESIVKKIQSLRNTAGESFQPYHLSKDGTNSVTELASGKNIYAPGLLIPFKGDGHYGLTSHKHITQLGYSIPNKGSGYRDNLPNAIRMIVKHNQPCLFYGYIVDLKSATQIKTDRKKQVDEFKKQLDVFFEFVSMLSGVDTSKLSRDMFRFIGFLPQIVGANATKKGTRQEKTIVDMNGNPIDALTGELL